MEELIKKLADAGKLETIKSEEDLRAAAKELGYSDEDIDNFMSELPLDDDALEQAAGGALGLLNPKQMQEVYRLLEIERNLSR